MILQAFFWFIPICMYLQGKSIMRIDKFLKVSRIIKRRTVANEACASGRVTINEKTAKPGSEVVPGDIIAIRFGERIAKYKVLNVAETVRKEQAAALFEALTPSVELPEETE